MALTLGKRKPNSAAWAFIVINCLVYYLASRPDAIDSVAGRWLVTPESLCLARPFTQWALAVILLLIVPLLSSVALDAGEPIRLRTGLSLPRWDLRTIALCAGGVMVMAASAWWASRRGDFQSEYPLCPWAWSDLSAGIPYYLGYLGYYLAWEFFFRGYIQLRMADRSGMAAAMAAQVLLSTLLHWGKPWPEFWGALPGGVFYGYLALATKSVWPSFFLHAQLGFLTDYFCVNQ
ncbi:MAG: CPBP family intramembrane metalloprotease [Elusimicrobia bacterium]|nr:CPBP family intramembrane metalloprotease [Elusimicrobiota bacterium]